MNPSPARVLHVVASSRGGGATHVRSVALGLDPAKYAVTVAMSEDNGTVRGDEFTSVGLRYVPLDIASGWSWSSLAAIRGLLRESDILHLHGARSALFGRIAAATLRARRPRVVYTIQGFAAPFYPQPRRAVQLGLEAALSPVVDRYVAVAEAEKRAYSIAVGVNPRRIDVIFNGVDPVRFSGRFDAEGIDRSAQRASLGVPADCCLITMVCRLYIPRDFETLLLALSAARAGVPNLHLAIVGDGPMRDEIQGRAAGLGLADHVTLAGWRMDTPAIYAATDIYTLTTWGWEGLPISVMESMACGCPAVATGAGGTPELIAHGETGYVVAPRSVEELAAAFRTLGGNAALRRSMGEAGRRRVEQFFTEQGMVANIAALYERVLAGQRA